MSTKVYRLTHIENIPHILDNGITCKNSPKANAHFVPIGDLSLISNRDNKMVKIDNGDFLADNFKMIILGDYTPFYFGIKMPMLYVIQNGGNFVPKAFSPSKIIIWQLKLMRLKIWD